MKKLAFILAVVFMLSGCGESYQETYDSGKEEGYKNGYQDGKEAGISDGYKEGYDTGYDTGYESGYVNGSLDGSPCPDEYNYYMDSLVYFEFPGNYELTYTDPDGDDESIVRAVIEFHGDDNDTGEYIGFNRQDLIAFGEGMKREGFTFDDPSITGEIFETFSDDNSVGYEIIYTNEAMFFVIYYDDDGDGRIDSTEYMTVIDGVLYQFIHISENGEANSKIAVETMVYTFLPPLIEEVEEYYGR